MKIAFILIIFTFFVSGCLPKKSVININRDLPVKFGASAISVSSVAIAPDQKQLTLTGQNLTGVTAVTITGPSVNKSFDIDSKSATSLTISAVSSGLKLLSSTLYSIVLSTAQGNATIPVEFSPSQLGATTGQVLKWNGTAWAPADLSGLNMIGSWDANTNSPTLASGGANTNPAAGDFYIVSTSGTTTIDTISTWNNGDWIIYNGTTLKWERVDNASGVSSFNTRTGAITPTAGDYDHSQIANGAGIYFDYKPNNVVCIDGEVLKYDSTLPGWKCAADDNTVAPAETDPTVTAFAKAALPTCGVGEVLKADGTNLSCVPDADTTIADTTLSEVQVEGYIANDVTTNYIPFDNGTKLVDSNLYQNGLVMEVAAGRDFCINGGNCLSAMSATVGTVTNVTVTPPLAVATGTTTPALSLTLPTCGVGQVLKSDGSNFSCVTDAGGSAGSADASSLLGESLNPTLATDTTTDGQILVWSQTNSRWEVGSQTVDTNTNAQTICTGATFLDGNGTCTAMTVDTNTNAGTLCVAGQYLDGDGTCKAIPVDTTLTIGTAATEVMGADAVPNCLASEKLSMSAGPVFSWSCITDVDTNTQLSEATVEGFIGNDVTTNYVAKGNGTKLVTSQIFDDGTNVGIGTITPASKISIFNNANVGTNTDGLANSILYLNNGGVPDGSIILKSHNVGLGNSVGALKFQSSPDGLNYSTAAIKALAGTNGEAETLSFYTSNGNSQADAPAEVMRLMNGDAGIGTSAPLEKLDVAGAIKIGTTANSNAGAIRWNGTNFQGYNGASWLNLDSQDTTIADTQLTEAQVEGYIGNDVTAGYLPYGNGTKLTSSGMFWDNTNSRLGIGTAVPENVLHLNVSDPTIKLTDSDTAVFSTIGTRNDGALILSADAGNTGASEIVFLNDGLEKMRLDNNGHLGIGVTLPTHKLHVNAAANGTAGGLFIDAKTRDSAETNVPLIQVDAGLAGANGTALWVNTAGNVGIGTNTPSHTLDLATSTTNVSKYGINQSNDLNATVTGSYTQIGQHNWVRPTVQTGITNTGTTYGHATRVVRNTSAVTGDSGTLTSLIGMHIMAGHANDNAETPVTTNVRGISISPQFGSGTITSYRALELGSPTISGATVGEQYGVYQADANQSNYFNGKVGLGVTAPVEKLEVGGRMLASDYKTGTGAVLGDYYYEWKVTNTSTNPGERVIAVLDTGATIETYDAIQIEGEVIDHNGNYGSSIPTVSPFTAFVEFSNGSANYAIRQDKKTNNIILKLRKVSANVFHLTANCPTLHTAVEVSFHVTEGVPDATSTITVGDPNTIDTTGTEVIATPTYDPYRRGPIFSVTNTTSVSTPATNTYKKVPFATEDFDPENAFDTVNNRFQPSQAGYYRVSYSVLVTMTGTGGFTLTSALFKNGAQYRSKNELINYSAGFSQSLSLSTVVYLNGSTDYLEVFYKTNSGTANVNAGSTSFFSGEFIRE